MATARHNLHVLVSGAGVAGNALAVLLGKAGVRVSVIERTESCLSQGHNIDVEGLAVQVFRKELQLLDELKKHNTTEAGTSFVWGDGSRIASFPVVRKDGVSRDGPTSEYEVLRGDLSHLLYQGAKVNDSVNFYLGKSIEQVFHADSDSGVSVELDDGTKLDGHVLVIADGQWSRLRSQFFSGEGEVEYAPMDMYIAYCTIPERPDTDDAGDDNRFWRIYNTTARRALSIRPDPHGTMRAMAAVMPRSSEEREMLKVLRKKSPDEQRAVFRRIFKGAGWQADRILKGMEDADDFYYQIITQIKMPKWNTRGGAVVCVGDAAYCPTPLSGMGASLAIDGAYFLAGELTKYRDGQHATLQKACDAYEVKMRPIVKDNQPFSPWFIYPRSAIGLVLLRSAFWLAGKLANSGVLDWFMGGQHEKKEAEAELKEGYDFTPKSNSAALSA